MDDNDTQPETTEARDDTGTVVLADAPASVKGSKRFAVYDRVLAQYVGGVSDDKPTMAEAAELVGHEHVAVVEV